MHLIENHLKTPAADAVWCGIARGKTTAPCTPAAGAANVDVAWPLDTMKAENK